MAQRKTLVRWLLGGDPAIRWQVLRDLAGAPAGEVAAERARVAREGWGAALLALQAPAGHWGPPDDDGWMITMEAVVLLKDLGADPADPGVRAALERLAQGVVWWQLEGQPFFEGETEACINGRILAAGAYFGMPCDVLLGRLLGEQLADGGWNCEEASLRSSFHPTLCVLEALLEYEKTFGATAATRTARDRAESYLLERRLLRSLRTGAPIDRRFSLFSFPTKWNYDVLRALDYFRAAGTRRDERMAEAIGVVEERRHQNGRWPMNCLHVDRIPFPLEPEIGRASRWNTLRALRVLDVFGV